MGRKDTDNTRSRLKARAQQQCNPPIKLMPIPSINFARAIDALVMHQLRATIAATTHELEGASSPEAKQALEFRLEMLQLAQQATRLHQ